MLLCKIGSVGSIKIRTDNHNEMLICRYILCIINMPKYLAHRHVCLNQYVLDLFFDVMYRLLSLII